MIHEHTFITDDGRELTVQFDDEKDLLIAVPKGKWRGMEKWPEEGGTTVSFTTDYSHVT